MSARAMVSICCSPPLRRLPLFLPRSLRRGNVSYTFSSVHASGLSLVRAAMVRFSVTDRDGKIMRPCGTRPMPAREIWLGGSPTSSLPLNLMLPLRGGVRPMMERMVVVLPMPFRPRSAITFASPTSMLTPCST